MTRIVSEINKKNRTEFTKNFGRRFINSILLILLVEDSSVEGTHLRHYGIGRLIGDILSVYYLIYSEYFKDPYKLLPFIRFK